MRVETRDAISDPSIVWISAVSVWELAIKREAGKLEAPDDLEEAVKSYGYAELPVTFRHAELAASLPLHHRDPFDRMLVAQAQAEGLTLVTNDSLITLYDVPTMSAR